MASASTDCIARHFTCLPVQRGQCRSAIGHPLHCVLCALLLSHVASVCPHRCLCLCVCVCVCAACSPCNMGTAWIVRVCAAIAMASPQYSCLLCAFVSCVLGFPVHCSTSRVLGAFSVSRFWLVAWVLLGRICGGHELCVCRHRCHASCHCTRSVAEATASASQAWPLGPFRLSVGAPTVSGRGSNWLPALWPTSGEYYAGAKVVSLLGCWGG